MRPAWWASGTWASVPPADRTGTARFGRARPTSASIPRSSWPPPATACRPSTSRTAASSASIPADPIAVQLRPAVGRLADGPREPEPSQGASQPRSRPDHRQRHQPHRLHDGRQGGALERRGHGGRLHRARRPRSSSSTAAKPFFLFFAPHDPHVPRVPHPRFAGATPMGPRGDAIAQLDWSVGEVLATLDRLKLARGHARPLHERQRPGHRRRVSG